MFRALFDLWIVLQFLVGLFWLLLIDGLVSQENIPMEQRTEYAKNLAKQLFTDAEDNKVLALRHKPPAPAGNHLNALRLLQQNRREGQPKTKSTRWV